MSVSIATLGLFQPPGGGERIVVGAPPPYPQMREVSLEVSVRRVSSKDDTLIDPSNIKVRLKNGG